MKKIEAIIQPFKLDDVKEALSALGTQGLTVSEVIGFSSQRERTELYRGREYLVNFLPQVKLEIIVIDEIAAQVAETIEREARTGRNFDGKILVMSSSGSEPANVARRLFSELSTETVQANLPPMDSKLQQSIAEL
jgi:nitrogen regulatory protein P-II 1